MSYTSRLKQTSILVATTLLLTACGGGGSGSAETNTSTPTTQAPTNHAPIIQDYSITTNEDTPLTLTLKGSDVDGNTLTYKIKQQPSHGTINGNTYTPAKDYNGADSFTFVANDGKVDSQEATVNITVTAVNDVAVATVQSLSTNEDTAKNFTLSGSDVDGDTLTYKIKQQPSHGTINGNTYTPAKDYNGADSFTFVANDGIVDSTEATVNITVTAVNDAPVATAQTLTTDEDSSVTFLATDADGDTLTYEVKKQPTHGTISGNTYTPNQDYFGTDSFTFVANDGTSDSAEATVNITITAVSDAPVATAQTLTTAEDTAKTFTLRGTDIDNDDSTLTYTVKTQPTHGTISGNTYTPNQDYFGADRFTFVANDGTSDSTEARVSISISPVEDIPIANTQTLELEEDNTTVITLTGTDPDRDRIVSYTITAFPQHGYLSGYYNRWTYHPQQNYHGTDSFSFKVNDGKADSMPASINLTVKPINDAPFAYSSNYKIAKNTSVAIEVNATDVDHRPDEITYVITGTPTNGNYDEASKTYTPASDFTGVDSFTYTATDPDGLSSTGTVYVNVGIKAPYITTWKTDNEGNTTNTQIKIGTYSNSNYNFTVEWGDGSKDENVTQSIVHDYATAGTYTIKISGEYPQHFMGSSSGGVNNHTNFDAKKLLSIEQWGDIRWKSMKYAFYNASNMLGNANDVPNLSAVTDMTNMFYGASAFNQDIGAWDVSAVTDMRQMFLNASSFNQDLSTWDVSAVTNMAQMFYRASSFNQDLSTWDVSAVTDMSAMFFQASAFNQDLSSWDVSAATTMRRMFYGATSFDQDLGEWDVFSVLNSSSYYNGMGDMFKNVTLSTANYDSILTQWSALPNLNSNIVFDGGNSQYSAAAQAARDTLINDHNWTVTDGGGVE